jgi:hypothetical protein
MSAESTLARRQEKLAEFILFASGALLLNTTQMLTAMAHATAGVIGELDESKRDIAVNSFIEILKRPSGFLVSEEQ